MQQQVAINGIEFARRSDSLHGELAVVSLARLEDLLFERGGTLTYALSGSLGNRGEPLLRLRVEGVLRLQCQRCMEGLEHELAIDSVFELLAGDSELTQEEVEDDSRDHLSAEEAIDVVALIEDEVILGLPVVPRHEDCSAPSRPERDGANSPFGVLAALKQETH